MIDKLFGIICVFLFDAMVFIMFRELYQSDPAFTSGRILIILGGSLVAFTEIGIFILLCQPENKND